MKAQGHIIPKNSLNETIIKTDCIDNNCILKMTSVLTQ